MTAAASLNRAAGRAVVTHLVTAPAGTTKRAEQRMTARVLLDMLGVIAGPGGRDVLPDEVSLLAVPTLKAGNGNTDAPPARRANTTEPDDVAPRHTVPAGLRDLAPEQPPRPATTKSRRTHPQETPVLARPAPLPSTDTATDGPYIAALRACELFTDPTYQRPLDASRVNRMAKTWNPKMLGVLDVSDRGPSSLVGARYAIINGQHRCAAALKAVATLADLWVSCLVHEGLDPAGEARLMYELDRGTKALNSWDKWRARSAAGDTVVHDVEAVAAAAGMTVTPAGFGAVGAAERLVRTGGRELLQATVTLLVAAYGPTPAAVKAPVITGLGALLVEHADEITADRMVRALQSTSPQQLRAEADAVRQVDGGSLHALVSRRIVSLYNRTPGAKLTAGAR